MKYYHVDVFSTKPLAGNGLTVVFPDRDMKAEEMLKITQEFNQFETIFIFPKSNNRYPIRIFTVQEELQFAGHPIVGAGAVIHSIYGVFKKEMDICLSINDREIRVKSTYADSRYKVTMNQGEPQFLGKVINNKNLISASLGLLPEDIDSNYPVEVISTGLPYLLLPLNNALDKVKISVTNFEDILKQFGAKFVYVFDPETLEARTWDNMGLAEDVATGSAAGPLTAYMVNNGYCPRDEEVIIKQGRFVGRESSIKGWYTSDTNEINIQGDVAFFAKGEILL